MLPMSASGQERTWRRSPEAGATTLVAAQAVCGAILSS